MAISLRGMLRARLEKLREELQPEAGFDRRAYGYEDDGGDDATFEDVARENVAREDESPWARSDGDRARSAPDPSPAPSGEGGSRHPGTARGSPPRASLAAASRERRSARLHGGQSARTRGDAPSSPSPEAPASGGGPDVPADGSRPSPPRAHALKRVRSAGRSRRLRTRLQGPESLRELFLLREVIDRPVALRGHPRRQRPR